MSTSFQEAVEAVAKRRNLSEDEAALIVAETYGQVADIEDGAGAGRAVFDEPDDADVWLRDHTSTPTRIVKVDDDRSPQGTIFAQAERMQAKREADHYRELSRRTSLHEADG